MTTEVTAAEVIRSIGRLEGQQEQIIARLDRMDGRMDRLVFTMWVVGGGIIAAVGAVIVKLFLGE
jgi:stress response protein SCP2